MPLPFLLSIAPLITAYFYQVVLKKGDRILIHSAAGGVGLAALQLSQTAGLEVVASVGSDAKVDYLRKDFGLQNVINYNSEDFEKSVKRIYGSDKCLDIVLDASGGSQLKTDLALVRASGRVVFFGIANLSDRSNPIKIIRALKEVASLLTINAIQLITTSTSLVGLNMKRVAEQRPDLFHDSLAAIVDLFKQGKLKANVSKISDWTEVRSAHAAMESRGTTGKLIMRVIDDPK